MLSCTVTALLSIPTLLHLLLIESMHPHAPDEMGCNNPWWIFGSQFVNLSKGCETGLKFPLQQQANTSTLLERSDLSIFQSVSLLITTSVLLKSPASFSPGGGQHGERWDLLIHRPVLICTYWALLSGKLNWSSLAPTPQWRSGIWALLFF